MYQDHLTGSQCRLCHLLISVAENGRENVNSSTPHAVVMTALTQSPSRQKTGEAT